MRYSTYRWFPWSIAGVMGAVVAVNLALTYFAVSSSTGLVTKHPFNEGNGYNAILAAAARQDALGWNTKLIVAPNKDGRWIAEATLTGADHGLLSGLTVTGHITRPIEPAPAITLSLIETSPGHYTAPAEFNRSGQWEVRIVARGGADLYEHSERVFIK